MGSSVVFGKWLKYLYFAQLAHLFLYPLGVFTETSAVAVVVGRLISACMVFMLLRLAPAGSRYRNAAIFRGVELGFALLRTFVSGTLIAAGGSVFSMCAVYQEYIAHSEALSERDPKLAKKWERLFIWIIVYNVLVLPVEFLFMLPTVGEIAVSVVMLLGMALNVLYLVYLRRMRKLFE